MHGRLPKCQRPSQNFHSLIPFLIGSTHRKRGKQAKMHLQHLIIPSFASVAQSCSYFPSSVESDKRAATVFIGFDIVHS